MEGQVGYKANPGLRIDIAIGTGFLLETGIYCIYTFLFIAALPAMTSERRRKDPRSSRSTWVFLIGSGLMYLVATSHLVFAAFRFYKSFFLSPNGPISYLRNPSRWEFLGLIILLCIQTWLGDALVIYRCYFVWNNNLWLISIPVCLLLCQIGINAYVLEWLQNPVLGARAQLVRRLRGAIYPLALVQNVMTTSLIIFKILLQHRTSKQAGVVDVSSKLGLMRIVRIVVESAAVYTVQILILVILSIRRDNFQYVVQSAVTPSIGITFVLLALRVHTSRDDNTTSSRGVRSTLLPQWAHNINDSENCSEDFLEHGSVPAVDGNRMIDEKIDAQGENGEANSKSDVEPSSDTADSPKVVSVSLQSTIVY